MQAFGSLTILISSDFSSRSKSLILGEITRLQPCDFRLSVVIFYRKFRPILAQRFSADFMAQILRALETARCNLYP
jgi:hypothetical protein